MSIEKSAGAVIFSKSNKKIKYLLLHYQSGHWDFPKGNIEKGEKLEETVRREVQEETGIGDLKIALGFKETIKYFYKLKGKNIFKIVTFFLAETKTNKVKISWEHIGFKWLPYEEALERLTFDNAKDILKKAYEFLLQSNPDRKGVGETFRFPPYRKTANGVSIRKRGFLKTTTLPPLPPNLRLGPSRARSPKGACQRQEEGGRRNFVSSLAFAFASRMLDERLTLYYHYVTTS